MQVFTKLCVFSGLEMASVSKDSITKVAIRGGVGWSGKTP